MFSIITPVYNSEKFLSSTINSVISQTFNEWELILVDDCSTDDSRKIIESYMEKDGRIKYYKTNQPSGSPALPRNIGIEKSNGRFIAFLDSDDIWESRKLEEQKDLFQDNSVAIVFSNYEKIDENGLKNNRVITAPEIVDYQKLLKGNVIACSTCVYDTLKVGKIYFKKQGHEDFSLWLEILKKGFIAKNTCNVSAQYRVRSSSISSNKLKVITWIFLIYRRNEKMSIFRSIFYTSLTLFNATLKYLK